MKKSIIEKANKLDLRVSDNPVNYNDENIGYKYFVEYYNTYKLIGRFKTQRELEEFLDDEIKNLESLDHRYEE